MMKKNKNQQFLVLMMLMPMLLAMGCTRHVSRGVNNQGEVEQAIFPDERNIVQKGGSVPNLDNLRMLGQGLSKDQLRGLVGGPHFREGFAAREWDYLFQLRTAGSEPMACRLKVVFDQDALARTLLWAPAQCAQTLRAAPAVVSPVASAPAATAQGKTFTLSADVLFPFGKWAVHEMSAAGRQRVQQIARELEGVGRARVKVLGYADRIGSEHANLWLSQRRAESVRQVLVDAGVLPSAVVAQGMGESTSVHCSDRLPRREQVACLAPDRRVEIVVSTAT